MNPNDIGRATLSRVLLGESARLDYIPSGTFSPELARIWGAVADLTREGEAIEPGRVAGVSGVDFAAVTALIDPTIAHGVRSAEAGVALLTEYLQRRKVAGAAERLVEAVQKGDGVGAWQDLLEAHARLDTMKGKAGEAPEKRFHLLTLADCKAVQRRERIYLCPGIDAARRTMIVSPSETGKTWVGIELAVKAAGGGRVFGEFQVARPLRVLVLAAEDYEDDYAVRVRNLVAGSVVDEDLVQRNLLVMSAMGFWFGNEADVAFLRRVIEDFKPDLLIIDTLSEVHDIAKLADAEAVAEFFRERITPLLAVTSGAGRGIILNYHTNKLGYDDKDEVSESVMIHGSDGFRRAVETVLVLRPAPDVDNTPDGGFCFVVSSNKGRVGRKRGSGKYLVAMTPDQNAIRANLPDDETPVALVYRGELSQSAAAQALRRKKPEPAAIASLRAAGDLLTKSDLAARASVAERTVERHLKTGGAHVMRFVRKDDGALQPVTPDEAKALGQSVLFAWRSEPVVSDPPHENATGEGYPPPTPPKGGCRVGGGSTTPVMNPRQDPRQPTTQMSDPPEEEPHA